MIIPELTHIEEPSLTFGYKQKSCDPRDGLMLFGPNSRNKLSGQISIGIIGPKELREVLFHYLKRIHYPIINEDKSIARPSFPGIQTVFDIHINFDSIPQIEIDREEINKYIKYADNYQRVHNLVNLYTDKLKAYIRQEEVPVNVWMVIIPEVIFQYGRPNSRIPSSDDNVKTGLKPKDRKSQQLNLFFQEEINELKEAYEFEVNFHNQLKAKLLDERIVTQIIRESKINYENLWTDESKIEQERKFDSAKAWNISTTLYYKSGGLPWKLGDIREGVCYLGLVYKKIEPDEKNNNACCAAQMFLDSGDGMVFRGNVGPWYNPKTKEFHLSQKDAFDIISQSLEAFKSSSGMYPKEIFIHAKTFFENEEWSGFIEATEAKCKIIGVRIRDSC